MAKAWDNFVSHTQSSQIGAAPAKPRDWRKRMSDNIAYALLVYTALQIFMTMGALHGKGGSILPYFALVVLVAAIIPACRRFEKRWNRLSDGTGRQHRVRRMLSPRPDVAVGPRHRPALPADRRVLGAGARLRMICAP